MKLLSKTSIYYLLFAVPVFIVCSIFLYIYVSYEIRDNVDESLWKDRLKIEQKLKAGKSIDSFDDEVSLQETESEMIDNEALVRYSDTLIYDTYEEELLPYRIEKSIVSDGKKHYLLTITKSTIESDDLIESIFYPIIILFILLLFGFFFINWYVSKKLWRPFYSTIRKLNNYKISQGEISFDASSIKEFSELNKTLGMMTDQMQTDFISQKQFIENASHEIQTPLAVVKTKIELLIQSSTLSENDMLLIQSIYNASNKLSSLNKALLLLSKIENNQFKEEEKIEIENVIGRTLTHLEDLISIKIIKVEKNYSNAINSKINPVLADILISNLIQNAIRHNIENGSINIQIKNNSLIISNTSDTAVENTNELFHRFRKNEASSESLGLGLAIVKEICEKNNIAIQYSCIDKTHSIELKF